MGYVRCLKHVLPIMQKQGRGRVVNLIGNDGVKPSYWEIAPGAAGDELAATDPVWGCCAFWSPPPAPSASKD